MIENALVELVDPLATVYPAVLVQEPDLPALVYQRISTRRDHAHDGPAGLASVRFQFGCWAASYPEAKVLAALLRSLLDGFKGTVAGVRIEAIFSAGELDDYEPDTKRHRVIADYIVWHEEVEAS